MLFVLQINDQQVRNSRSVDSLTFGMRLDGLAVFSISGSFVWADLVSQ
jgi:hypothetical protein